MGLKYIIEHMEEDEDTPRSIPPWVELEYAHMRALAGPDAQVHFTALSSSSQSALENVFGAADEQLAEAGCHTIGIRKPNKSFLPGMGMGGLSGFYLVGFLVCDVRYRLVVLLTKFTQGDDPPRDRTSELRKLGFPTRHLGSVQMTTDTALGVTKRVVHDKVPLDKIPYTDFPTIRFNARESVEMPFRYIVKDGEPLLPPGMRELLHKDLDKGFEF